MPSLLDLFSPSGPSGPAAPLPIDPMQLLQKVAGQQTSDDEIRRRSIAKGLLEASTKLASTPGDFLTGLGQAVPAGAGGYLDTKSGLQDQNATRAQSLFKDVLGYDTAKATQAYRNQNAQATQDYRNTMSRQGEERIGLQRDANALRAGDAKQRLGMQERQLQIAEDKHSIWMQNAPFLAKKIANEAVSSDPAVQERNLRFKVEDMLRKYRDAMKLDDPDNPYFGDQKLQAEQKYSEYAGKLYKDVGLKPGAGARQSAPAPAPAPSAPVSQVPGQLVQPQTQEDFNALPPGTLFINPADGKQYRKR